MNIPSPAHIDAVDALAQVIAAAEGFMWPDTEAARDVWREKTHAAMLDALTRHGVLTVSYGYRNDPPGLGIWQPGLDLTTTRLHALGRPVVSRHSSGWREVS